MLNYMNKQTYLIVFTKIIIFYFTSVLTCAFIPGYVAADANTLMDRYISLAIQGDLSTAQKLFDETDFTRHDSELPSRHNARFVHQTEDLLPATGDEFADQVILAYRNYWAHTLTGRLTPQEGQSFLWNSLVALLQPSDEPAYAENDSTIYIKTGALLQEKGFFYLEAEAPPLRDLFLWKNEETIEYAVGLTDQSQVVEVTFMSDIYSMGWKEFATLGLVATTGWVEGKRLYCVGRSYDRSSENFRVSYLKHESRHLADFERFPGLSSSELEYRAKLTELAFASTTLNDLLIDFTNNSAPNPESPHAFANYRVTKSIYQEIHDAPMPKSTNPWQSVDPIIVNRAARILLEHNTGELLLSSR